MARKGRDWWWGPGAPPLEQWPGVTIEMPTVWSSRAARWESPDGRFYFDAPAATKACEFFPDLLRHHIGEFAGQPFTLMEYQAKLLTRPLFGWKRSSDGMRRFRKLFGFIPKGGGKALALDTAIATPDGWSTIGALQPGDLVFDEVGRPTRVIGVSDVMVGRPCSVLTFDDDSTLVADDEHLWLTEARRGERFAVRTTQEIARTLRNSNGRYQSANHSIPLTGPLATPKADLPIDPYVLGVWLGDGDADAARITVGDEDIELLQHVAECGVEVRKQAGALRYGVGAKFGGPRCQRGHDRSESNAVGQCRACERERGRAARRGQQLPPQTNRTLQTELRAAGLLHNKHIPSAYLRASVEQRLALLQGLMDTDGYIAQETASCEFCSTDQRLAEGTAELILSLGIKVVVRESAAKLYGREVSRRWRMLFHPPSDLPVFRLRRKLRHQYQRHNRRRLSGERRIVDVRAIASVPVKCISIDAPSQLYLAGRSMIPTHNSPWAAATGIYLARCDREAAAEVYAVANDRQQARTVHDNAKIMIEQSGSPLLSAGCEILKDSIYWKASHSTYMVLSSEASTAHGKRPHGVIFDELHGQKNRDLYEALKKSMIKRRQPMMLIITHAGTDDEGICFEEYEYAKSVLSGTNPDDTCLPVIFEMASSDDWTSPIVHARVNPGYGITVKADAIEAECAEARSEPRKQNDFKRFHGNVWVNQATAWIPVEWWDACDQPLPTDDELNQWPCDVGIDMAQKIDLAAAVAVFKLPLDDVEAVAGDATVEQVEVVAEEQGGAIVKRTHTLDYQIVVVPNFWLPEETLKDRVRQDGVRYDIWEKEGLLHTVDGAIVGAEPIVSFLAGTPNVPGLIGRYPRLKGSEFAYDPAFATDVALALRDDHHLKVVEVLQHYKYLSEACQVFEALVKAKRVRHGGHRLLRWNMENVAVKRDDAGRIRPVKPRKATKRIDGVVAILIALSRLMTVPLSKRKHRGRARIWTPEGLQPMSGSADVDHPAHV